MTALEIAPISTPAPADVEAPPIRWEPCAAFADDGAPACAACGWLADDHDDDDVATVVALPVRPVLRRAS